MARARARPASAAFLVLAVTAFTSVVAATGCGSGTPAAAQASVPVVHASHAAKACTLKDTPAYLVRSAEPGTTPVVGEIGNADLVNCTTALQDFAAQAGQWPGECSTIALASSSPGYNVDASTAPPLRGVIVSAGPGC